MKRLIQVFVSAIAIFASVPLLAQIPQIINYQGRMTVSGVNFNGNGQFKFALVDGAGTVLWSNAPVASSQPNAHVVLPVTNGIYSVFLGDTALPNMAAIPTSVFSGADVRVRIWFNNGIIGFQQLSPDQRVAAVGYAMMADGVKDGAITSTKLATGAVTSTKIAAGAVTSTALANGAVTSSAIANGAVGSSQLADGAVGSSKIAAGAVTTTQIAAGAITRDKLFKQYDGGKINIFDYDLTEFPTGKQFPITFSAPFQEVPSISLGTEGQDSSFLDSLRPTVKSPTEAGFTMSLDGFRRTDTEILQVSAVQISSSGVATRTVSGVDLMIVGPRPAIAYVENGRLFYRRSTDTRGISWEIPVPIDAAAGPGTKLDLFLQNGNPAIAYTTPGGTLYFVRATDANGTAWGTRGTVIASGVTGHPVGGSAGTLPAIALEDPASTRLQFVRATNAAGTTWAAPVIIAATADAKPSAQIDFATVNGQPALTYSSTGGLVYIRSTAVDGSTWPASPTVVTSNLGIMLSPTITAKNPRFIEINGNPAICFGAVSRTQAAVAGLFAERNYAGAVYCARANDANGTAWAAVTQITAGESGYTTSSSPFPGGGSSTLDYLGEAGDLMMTAVISGVPTLLTKRDKTRYENVTVSSGIQGIPSSTRTYPNRTDSVCIFTCSDAAGTSWREIKDLGEAKDKYPQGTLQGINGSAAWASLSTNEATLVSLEGANVVSRPVPVAGEAVTQTNGALGAITLASGRPLVAFFDPGEKTLKASTAADTYGTAWNEPKTIGNAGNGIFISTYGDASAYYNGEIVYTGPYGAKKITADAAGPLSLGNVQGFPSIAYVGGSPASVSFLKASTYDGLVWNAPVTVLSGSGISAYDTQMLILNGNPAIFFRQDNSLKVSRATNAGGAAWGAPVTIVTDAGLHHGARVAMIAGNPAVVFGSASGSNFTVKFVRATDVNGTAWPAPSNAQSITGHDGFSFHTLALGDVGGTPAIAFHNTIAGRLTYTRSGVVAGTGSWSTPVEVDPMPGFESSLRGRSIEFVPGPNPTLLYQVNDPLDWNGDVRGVAALDATGTTWTPPYTVLTVGNTGWDLSVSAGENAVYAVCHDYERTINVQMSSIDGGRTWRVVKDGPDFPAGEHFCVAMGGNIPLVFFRMLDGLYIARAMDAEASAWQVPFRIQGKIDAGTPGPGSGFFPSAAVIGGRMCVSFYDADFGNLWFMRSNNAVGGSFSPVVNVAATNDVGGYSSLAEVNGRPAIAYYNFTNKTLHFSRAFNATGADWLQPVTVVGTAGNGEFCQLVILGGMPAILYHSAADKRLMLVRATNIDGTAWGTPAAVDDGNLPNGERGNMGRFAKMVTVNGKPSVVYKDSTTGFMLYKRATDANASSWGPRITLTSSDDTGLFPAMTPVANMPCVFHFDRARASIRSMLPSLPFSVNWTAVEQ